MGLGETRLEVSDHIAQPDVRENIRPGEPSVPLSEVDEAGMEYRRDMKAITISAHNCSACRDVPVKCIQFVVPESREAPAAAPESCVIHGILKCGSSPTTSTPTTAAARGP